MKQSKQIKKLLKTKGKWEEYKNVFTHKQMRLATSKIALVFNEKISINKLTKIELDLMSSEKNSKMFDNAFKELSLLVNYKADWKSLGKFMWYQYQTSTYYKDIKVGVKNIYNPNNIIEINEKRRGFYLKWLHSIGMNDSLFNEKIIQVSKIVF